MRSHNGSNGTPLDPPLFSLDNTFKHLIIARRQYFCMTGYYWFVKPNYLSDRFKT